MSYFLIYKSHIHNFFLNIPEMNAHTCEASPLNYPCCYPDDSPPSYTLVSGLPPYDDAFRQFTSKPNATSAREYPSVFQIFQTKSPPPTLSCSESVKPAASVMTKPSSATTENIICCTDTTDKCLFAETISISPIMTATTSTSTTLPVFTTQISIIDETSSSSSNKLSSDFYS